MFSENMGGLWVCQMVFSISRHCELLDQQFQFYAQGIIKMFNYSHRQTNQPISQSYHNLNTRKNRLISTVLNPLNQSAHFPQLSRSSSSSKSTKLKLTTIEGTLSSIEQQLQTLKADTRQSRRFTNYLKDQLTESQLGMIKLQLNTEVNKLDKAFKLAKKHNEDRTQYLKNDCDGLLKRSRKMKGMLSLLQTKLDKCESVMGLYSGNFLLIAYPSLKEICLVNNSTNKIIMYNLFKYINDKHQNQAQLKKTKKESEYQLRHEEFKKKAFENMKERADQFLYNQVTAESPFTFEDDHYRTWRQKKQFRDVENSEKFIGFKTFRHRPNEDMDKFYTPRERRQMEYLATKKEDLVRSGVLESDEISRSQRSQGPFNPKIEFRVTKQDEECLQPRLRFANITDKQRMSESATNFQERVQKIHRKFQTSKDRLGKMMKSSIQRYYDQASSGIHSGQFYKKSQSLQKKQSHLQNPQHCERDMSMVSSTKMSQYFEQRNQARRKSKIYFKLTKTMQMMHPDPLKRQEFDILLKRSQYDRLRDLHNIKHNTFNENHSKDAIL